MILFVLCLFPGQGLSNDLFENVDNDPKEVKLIEGNTGWFLCDHMRVGWLQYYGTSVPYDPWYAYQQWRASAYFCRQPCAWSDIKAYSTGNEQGKVNMTVVFNPNKGTIEMGQSSEEVEVGTMAQGVKVTWSQNTESFSEWRSYVPNGGRYRGKGISPAFNVTMINVTSDMTGEYKCMWWTRGTDYGQTIKLTVLPAGSVSETIVGIQKVKVKENVDINENNVLVGGNREADAALAKCKGNHACALALLQSKSLNVSHCWWCLQMAQRWRAKPISPKISEEMLTHLPCKSMKTLPIIVRPPSAQNM
ncbi:MAG: immunoglobulin domain-containing protein [Aeromonas sp.]